VVESLDEAAYGASERFEQAREAFYIGPLDDIDPRDFPPETIERIKTLRTQHAKLFERWISRTITPRELRVALVRYYVRQGCRQIDERFFLRHDERPVDEGKK
jgi:hypothetical protein